MNFTSDSPGKMIWIKAMKTQDSFKVTALDRAKKLRKRMTQPERIIWQMLRAQRLGGHKFRRQYPIGHYIVDFVSCSHKLIIEVDGPYHEKQHDYDKNRTQFLQSKGFVVIRITNDDVYERADKIKSMILSVIEQSSAG